MTSSIELNAKKAKLIKIDRIAEKDPVEFFRTLLFTFDPKREPYHLPFDPFDFQVDLIHTLVDHIERGEDLFIDKCREMGVTYTVLGVFLWFWKYRDASNFLIGSRKESVVDNVGGVAEGEVSNKEESLFGKLDYMVDRIPSIIRPVGFNPQKHRTFMNLRNPEIGNVIAGESTNPNFSRGGRQKAIMLDEFAFWENDTAAWGSTADTTNCRIILTTPGIRPNTKAKRLRFNKDSEKIKVVSLTHDMDPRKDKKWLDEQRSRRSAEDFAREVMINWEGSTAGIVYPEARNRVVGDFPYNPEELLFVSWDFGLDGTAMQWWQPNSKNGKMRLIDAFTRINKPIQWFFPLLGLDIDSQYEYSRDDLNAIDRTKYFRGATHYGDPDVKKRSMANKDLTSVNEELIKVNIYVQTNTTLNTFVDRREKTKTMLQRGTEINETPGTERWMEDIDNARYPQRPDNSQSTAPINKPIHDQTSHHRTSTEYFAVNYSSRPKYDTEETSGGEYDGDYYD